MLATFRHTEFSAPELLARKTGPITVCVPAKEIATRVTTTIERLLPLCQNDLIDQLLVVDADSADGTAQAALRAGADVVSESELLPELGPVQGKGDAMWRALEAATGELVVYLDGDVGDVGPHYVTGLLGPLLTRPEETAFVKAFYRRPFELDGHEFAEGGGRVTELTAKPLLELAVSPLGAFHQPLAGELAARRDLLEAIPFLTSYGVEIAMLIEVWARCGLERMAQVDLGTKRNAHQGLDSLGGMAREVLEAVALTLGRHPRVTTGSIFPAPADIGRRLTTRPPMREARGARASGDGGGSGRGADGGDAARRRG
ncbi:MAG TPA: glucosyl-3-phosphoglycerate synthase [Solirubrobacterales bacterium]|nr:glucosyl-3-phosphoglycerate synthase [Solirubrobacterales bacterium]